MDFGNIGRILLLAGLALALLGGLLLLLSRIPFFSALGSLPGDLRIEGQGFTCIVPLATMLLISVLLTVGVNLITRILNR